MRSSSSRSIPMMRSTKPAPSLNSRTLLSISSLILVHARNDDGARNAHFRVSLDWLELLRAHAVAEGSLVLNDATALDTGDSVGQPFSNAQFLTVAHPHGDRVASP